MESRRILYEDIKGDTELALLLGITTVSIAPLFTLRRMRRMDIPSTLRLVE